MNCKGGKQFSPKESRQSRHSKDSRNSRHSRHSRHSRDSRDSRDSRNLRRSGSKRLSPRYSVTSSSNSHHKGNSVDSRIPVENDKQ